MSEAATGKKSSVELYLRINLGSLDKEMKLLGTNSEKKRVKYKDLSLKMY